MCILLSIAMGSCEEVGRKYLLYKITVESSNGVSFTREYRAPKGCTFQLSTQQGITDLQYFDSNCSYSNEAKCYGTVCKKVKGFKVLSSRPVPCQKR